MKYDAIEKYLIDLIENGELKVHDQIPMATELANKFNVSELTVGKALTSLASKGYIVRIKGKGSFVSSRSPKDVMTGARYYSLSEDIMEQGMKPGSILKTYEIIDASKAPDIQEALHLQPTEKLHYFVRVRTGDGIPIAVAYSYMPIKYIPYIDTKIFDNGSLWKFLADSGFVGTKTSHYVLSAVLPTDDIAEWLNISKDQPLLLSKHISITAKNEYYNYNITYYLTTKFQYRFTSDRGLKVNGFKG